MGTIAWRLLGERRLLSSEYLFLVVACISLLKASPAVRWSSPRERLLTAGSGVLAASHNRWLHSVHFSFPSLIPLTLLTPLLTVCFIQLSSVTPFEGNCFLPGPWLIQNYSICLNFLKPSFLIEKQKQKHSH